MSEQSRKYLSIHQPPQNSTVKLFMTQEKIKSWYRHETRREEERFTSSRPEPSRSAWRAEQWGQCLGRVLPPWPSFKEPRSTDGHCLGSDGSEGFSQSVSVLSSWINLCHFWNTQITPSSAVWAVSNLQLRPSHFITAFLDLIRRELPHVSTVKCYILGCQINLLIALIHLRKLTPINVHTARQIIHSPSKHCQSISFWCDIL